LHKSLKQIICTIVVSLKQNKQNWNQSIANFTNSELCSRASERHSSVDGGANERSVNSAAQSNDSV